jgi:hypothetical protein
MGSVASIPAPPHSPAAPVRRQRNRQSILPKPANRSSLTLNISTSVDLNLEFYSLLVGRMKNEIALESITSFLTKSNNTCDDAHQSRSGAKVRVTFILTKDLQGQLDEFVEAQHCNHACAVTAALVQFFKKQKINAFKNPSKIRLLEALRS